MAPRDLLTLVAINTLWGSTYLVTRGAVETVPPHLLAFLRMAIATGCFAAIGSLRTAKPVPLRSTLWTAGVGLAGFCLSKVLMNEGLLRSTATEAALLVHLEGIFTACLGGWLLRQRLGAVTWLGVIVAFLGAGMMAAPRSGLSATHAFGNLLIVGSMGCEACASVGAVPAQRGQPAPVLTARACAWGSAFLLPLALRQWAGDGWATDWLTAGNVIRILYLALGATVIAYTLWFRILARVEAGRVAAFLYLQPVVGTVLGLLAGERPPPGAWLGGGLVFLGLLLVCRRPPSRA